LLANGEREAARAILDKALAQIGRRAAILTDAADRESFLANRPENRRAFELRDAWTS
jgi:hypothetical protein